MVSVERIYSESAENQADAAKEVKRKSTWLLVFGIALVAFGLYVCSHAVTTTLISVFFLGGVMVAVGSIHIIQALSSEEWKTFLLHIVTSSLYLIFGFLIIRQPTVAAITVTAFLAAFFFTGGLIRILMALVMRTLQWGWVLLNGVVSVILGVGVFLSFPTSAFWLLGLFVGIDIILTGWALTMFALALQSASRSRQRDSQGPTSLRGQTPAEA